MICTKKQNYNLFVLVTLISLMISSQSCSSGYVHTQGKRQVVHKNRVDMIHSGHAPKNFLFGKKEVPCSVQW